MSRHRRESSIARRRSSSPPPPQPSIEVHLYSDRKGSNPGGKCQIITPNRDFYAYIKYCPGSRLPAISRASGKYQPLVPSHQPIYEAITLALSRKMGLITPDFYDLGNKKKGRISFTYEPGVSERLNELQPHYFISKLMEAPPVQGRDSELAKARIAALASDKIYRDLLMISDISNKAQNYRYDPEQDRMIYLDLGCSFVNAVGGYLQKHNGRLPKATKQNLRRAEKFAQEHMLQTADGSDLISLEDLVRVDGDMPIPIIGTTLSSRQYHFVRLGTIITPGEMEEINLMLQLNLGNISRNYKNDSRLISTK